MTNEQLEKEILKLPEQTLRRIYFETMFHAVVIPVMRLIWKAEWEENKNFTT